MWETFYSSEETLFSWLHLFRFQDWNSAKTSSSESQISTRGRQYSDHLTETSSSREWIKKYFAWGLDGINSITRSFNFRSISGVSVADTKSRKWILDPQGQFLQRWNKIFVFSCVVAVYLDPLFFYIPVVDRKKNCLGLDKPLEITASVLRSFTDIFYILRIIFQFHTGYICPSSRVFGRGVLVEDRGAIAKRYLSSYFLIDVLAVLPLPQIFGATWYFFSIEREDMCWRAACSRKKDCKYSSLYCGRDNIDGGNKFLEASCPIITPNTAIFDFGIYLNALQSGVVETTMDFPPKLFYCLWWGLRSLSSLGQNLAASTYVWEILFAVSISIFGLVLFSLLIGNMQTYLQSSTVRLEEMRVKRRDAEQWMSHRLLPEDLKERIRRYEQYKWQETRGVDEEYLLRNLPKDLRRDIKRHLCLALLMRVPMFEKMDEQLLDAMCDRLKPVLYTENSFIIREGDPVDDMLFIMRGKLLTMTTNGGRTGFLNSDYLKAGDFCGEELLTWALVPIPLPTSQSRQELFHSQHWRTWAACFIQAAWRRYCRKKLEESLSEEENRLKDALAQTGGSPPSLGATIYASRFAANILRTIRPSGSRKARVIGMDNVPLICYYNGVLQHGTRDPIYVGGHTRAAWVWKNISFTEFVIKMHELCKVPSDQTTIDIRCRYLIDQHTSIAMRVEDDDSLSIIMNLHPDQCNAIIVYVEKLPCQKSNTTTQRHERGSSSVNAGGLDYMDSKAMEANINQLTSNSYDNSDSIVILDMCSSQFENSSSLPRYGKLKLKELEISSGSKLQEVMPQDYRTTPVVANEHLEQNDTVHFGIFSALLSSWFGMRILDPKDPYLQRWTMIIMLSCMLALALDALFFYIPGIDGQMSCLTGDKNLEIVTSVLRSITDIVYVLHIIFQFRTGFFVRSSRIVGSGEFVQGRGVMARRYLCSLFLVDILSVLPLPQVLTLIMPRMSGLIDVRKTNSLHYVVLLQYIPRSLRVYLLYKEVRIMNTMIYIALGWSFFNFYLYVLASHIYGALWYFFAVEREYICLRRACSNTTTCNLSSLYCGVQSTGGNGYLEAKCPIIEPNKTLFDFGIYLDVLQSGILKSSFPKKLMYCFWWGLQNLGSLGQNLKTSSYIWEVCFAVSISVFGSFMFVLLISNVQTYLESSNVRLQEMKVKRRNVEEWMSHRLLPENLKDRIRRYEQYKWQETRGFEEEYLLRDLPKDIRRDIKLHLCLDTLRRVSTSTPLF
ncbi:hypothetical protein IFM89_014981 [Coptis chinensis]|uniref:Cyclic nucleotide-binding domain-containing protein n=1 Tax=Coptis chinensis TaxID=261450 RepID=A0A835HL88_9MAGN|nr:hypothetical protein IFM89_014981 [Coptis chinensis]